MPRKKPNRMTHGQCREMICSVCHEKPIPKGSNRIVNEENYASRIRDFVNRDYNSNDRHCAKGLCAPCRNKLLEAEKNKALPFEKRKPEIEFPDPLDYSQMNFPFLTRSLGVTDLDDLVDCECFYCVGARDHVGIAGTSYVGHHVGKFPNLKRVPVSKPYNVCRNCWQVVGRGIRHPQPCSSSSSIRSGNAEGILNTDQKAKEKVASSTIREKQAEAPKGATSVALATGGNKEMKVPLPSSSKNSVQMQVQDVQNMMGDANLSLNQTNTVQKHIRQAFGRKSFTPNSKADLSNQDKSLEKFFTSVRRNMDSHDSAERLHGQVERVVVYSRGGTEPGSARLGSARLASIRGKSSGKARLGAGSKIFGS